MDTIFALSSAPGKAGVSVFRISGSKALKAVELLCDNIELKPQKARLVVLRHINTKEVIDKALAIYFKAPNSFNGEDIVEFHTHGSIGICNMLIDSLLKIDGFRLAEPGEFSKRAFLAGKMDLTAAEGLEDLIEAETSMQVKQAVRQMSGELGKLYESWRQILLKLQALLEAYIDFPDEDIPDTVLSESNEMLSKLKADINLHLKDNARGERLRNGIHLAIFGPPNAGKSSLINYLARSEVAIVSPEAGTTRDVIEIHLDINGYPIVIADTAGLRQATSAVEIEGIRRAQNKLKSADIKILIFDAKEGIPKEDTIINNIDDYTIILANKIDLISSKEPMVYQDRAILPVSIKNRLGLDQLLQEITKKAASLAQPTETPAITRLRYRQNLASALKSLEQFSFEKDIVLAAEDIRLAARALSMITGKISVDEILGEIFSNFCIGK